MYIYGSCSASLNFTNCKDNDNNQPLVKYQSIKRGVKKPDLLGSVPIQCPSGASDEALAGTRITEHQRFFGTSGRIIVSEKILKGFCFDGPPKNENPFRVRTMRLASTVVHISCKTQCV